MKRVVRQRRIRERTCSPFSGDIQRSHILSLTDYLVADKINMLVMERRKNRGWNARNIRALRYHLGLTQSQLADELGIRQQTVSEWETGVYRPRGTACTLLSIVAERAAFRYEAEARDAASHGSTELAEVRGGNS